MMSGMWTRLIPGDGHCDCDAPSGAIRASDEFWSRVHHDIQVGTRLFIKIHLGSPCSRHPDDLYINGIQRESFIPAIELIKNRFNVVDLDSGTGRFAPYQNPCVQS